MEQWYIINTKILILQFDIFIKPQKIDTADIKCFTVLHGKTKLIQCQNNSNT